MARISTYTTDSSIDGTEFLLGREADGTTKQFSLSALQTYLATIISSTSTFTTTIVPNADDSLDIGSSTAQWKDLYIDGIAYIDQIGTDLDPVASAFRSGGEIDGVQIGGESPSSAVFTDVNITGSLSFDGVVGTVGQVLVANASSATPTFQSLGLNGLNDVFIKDDSLYIGDAGAAARIGNTNVASKNTAVGVTALDAITTGDQNIAIGYDAGGAITTTSGNIAIGIEAGASMTSSGGVNILIGGQAGKSLTSGSYNIAIGSGALDASTVGDNNIAIGLNALSSLDTTGGDDGDSNVAIGTSAGMSATSMDGAVLIGHEAGKAITTGDSNVFVGPYSGLATTTGTMNVALGHRALATNIDGDGSVAIGHEALRFLEPSNGHTYNTAVGFSAGKNTTTGTFNTTIGMQAGSNITTGKSNTALGANALLLNNVGTDNVSIGENSLSSNVDGSKSVAVGNFSLESQEPSGAASMFNVAIGHEAGQSVTTGVTNTLVGGLAGDDITVGSNNVALGYNITFDAGEAENQIVIGSGAVGTSDNVAVIGNSSIANINPGSVAGCSLGDASNSYKDLYLNRKLVAAVNSQDLTITQFDGSEVAKIHDGGAAQSDADITAVGYGFGFKHPVLQVTADGGDKTVTLEAGQSGAIIHCDADTNNIIFNLPPIDASNKAGIHYTFVNTTAVNGIKTVKINTNGTDGNDKFLMYGFNGATSITDVAGDTLTIPNSAAIGTVVRITCLASGASNTAEIWLAEVFGASAVTNA